MSETNPPNAADIIANNLRAVEVAATPGGPDAVRHDPAQRAFVTASGARLEYEQPTPGQLVVTHTFVPETLRGQGIASRLMKAVLDHARQGGITAGATCDYARAYLERKGLSREVQGRSEKVLPM